MVPLIIIGVTGILIAVLVVVLYLKDHVPKKIRATESAWNFEPYSCAIQNGYDVHIVGEPDAMAAPPMQQPNGYIVQVEHKTKTCWLIPV